MELAALAVSGSSGHNCDMTAAQAFWSWSHCQSPSLSLDPLKVGAFPLVQDWTVCSMLSASGGAAGGACQEVLSHLLGCSQKCCHCCEVAVGIVARHCYQHFQVWISVPTMMPFVFAITHSCFCCAWFCILYLTINVSEAEKNALQYTIIYFNKVQVWLMSNSMHCKDNRVTQTSPFRIVYHPCS